MPTNNSYKWFVVGMLWFVCFFNYADRQAIFSVFPLLKTELNLSDMQLGIIGSAFMWVYAVAGPFAGMVGDRISRKTLIIGGLIFWSLVTIACALSTKYWHLVLFRALEGLGESFYFPASMSLVSDYHGKDTRSRAMAIHQSSVYAGTIAGGAAAGFLGQHYGWRSSFFLFGGLGTLLGLALLALLREPKRGQSEQPGEAPVHGAFEFHGGVMESLRRIFSHRMVPILMAVFIGANFVAVIFLTWMPSFLFRKFNMSLSMAGLNGTAYLQIASVCGVVTGGWLADRFAQRSRAGRMWTQTIGLLAGVPFIFLAGWTLSVPVLIIGMMGFGFSKGLYDANIWASLYDVVKPEHRATALGLMNSLAWLGGSAAPVSIAVAAATYGMSAAISASSIVYLLVGTMFILGIRAYMREEAKS
jgi:MFS family permease